MDRMPCTHGGEMSMRYREPKELGGWRCMLTGCLAGAVDAKGRGRVQQRPVGPAMGVQRRAVQGRACKVCVCRGALVASITTLIHWVAMQAGAGVRDVRHGQCAV